MSEEIINNQNGAVENPTANNETETQNQTNGQQGASLGGSLGGSLQGGIDRINDFINNGGAGSIEVQPEEPAFVKLGREMKQRVIGYNTDARNALAREVTEIQRNKETLLAEKQSLIDQFNRDMFEIEAEIKALEAEAKDKSEIACTGEKRENVLCDAVQVGDEIIYVPADSANPLEAEVIARTQRVTEQQEVM